MVAITITVQDHPPPNSRYAFTAKGSIIHSFIGNVLKTYSVPRNILDIKSIAMNKTRCQEAHTLN